MLKKLFALVSALTLLLASTLTVSAAEADLPLNLNNSWSLARTGGGDISYTIPYTGNYEISLSGSQGSAYSNSSGGYGYTLTKTVRLQYGDVICIHTPEKPTGYTTSGSTITVPAGNDAQLYVNDTLVWTAGAGAALVTNNIAPNGITSVSAQGSTARNYNVHWHSGNGKSGATHSNTFPTVYAASSPGGCYGGIGHTHDALFPCSWRYTKHTHTGHCAYVRIDTIECTSRHNGMSYFRCTACGAEYSHYDGGASSGWGWGYCDCPASYEYNCAGELNDGHQYTCGSPVNTWGLKCGYSQGQIVGINNDNGNCHACYYASGWNPATATLSNTGATKFSIRLVEQHTTAYTNTTVRAPYYLNDKANLMILDNTVCYFKRP